MSDLEKNAGHRYYRETMFDREQLIGHRRPGIAPAAHTKVLPEAEKHKLTLPEGLGNGLWRALARRRSRRRYRMEPISEAELAALLWAAQGVTAEAGPFLLRTAPSAGALHPLETYVAANRVDGLAPGLYHLDVRGFALELMEEGYTGERLARAAIHQEFVSRAAAVIVFSAVFRRCMAKYGDRAMRYICMDAGHACENLLLAAEDLGLAACPVAAFFDAEMNEIIDADGVEEGVIYRAAVGRPG